MTQEGSEAGAHFIRGGFISIASRAIGAFGGIVSSILLARGLGTFYYGIYSTALAITRTAAIASTAGMDAAVVRFAAGNSPDRARVATHAVSIGTGIAFAFSVALALSASFLAERVFRQPELFDSLRVAGGLLFLLALAKLLAATSRIEFAAGPAAIGQDLFPMVAAVVAGAMAVAVGTTPEEALGILAVGVLIGVGFLSRVSSGYLTRPHVRVRTETRRLLRFGIPAALSATFLFLLFRLDRFVLASLAQPNEVGIYTAAAQISLFPVMAMSAGDSVLKPLLGSAHRNSQKDTQTELFQLSSKLLLILLSPFVVLMIATPQAFLGVLFGDDYTSGNVALMILGLGQLVNLATGPIGTYLIMSGHERSWLLVITAATVLAGAICFLLIPRLGITGAAIGSASSIALLYVGGFWLAARQDGLKLDWSHVRNVGLVLAGALMLAGFDRIFSPGQFMSLFIAAPAAVVMAALMYRRSLTPQETLMTRQALRKRRR